MFSFFKRKPKQEETPKPKYILEPQAKGTYYVKQLIWDDQPGECDGSYQYYKIVGEAKDEEEGRQMIANLERPTIVVE